MRNEQILIVLLAMPILACAERAWAGQNVWTRLGPDSAIATSLAIDPQNPATVFATTDIGLFKSPDEGTNWSLVTPGPPCCISSLVINPQNPSTMYALTRVTGASVDRRILKSTNGGSNWSPVNSGLPTDDAGNYGVTSFAIDVHNPTTLYAANNVGSGGVFQTTDGGATWNGVSSGLPDGGVMALQVGPQSPPTIYASMRKGGVFQSLDGGASWSAVNTGLDPTIFYYNYISTLAIDPQNPDTVYAALQSCGECNSVLFKTTNAGANWTSLVLRSETVLSIAIDPFNTATVYAGTPIGIFQSIDGGTSWSAVKRRLTSDTYSPLVVSALAIDPNNSYTVYASTASAGIFKTTDAGANWTIVNSDLRLTAPRAVIALRTDPQSGKLYAVTTDDGIFKTADGGTTWTTLNAGLPLDPVYDIAANRVVTIPAFEIAPGDSNIMYVINARYQDVFRSTDGGASWSTTLARDPSGLVVRGTRLNLSALAIDPRNSRTLYAVGNFGQCCPTNGGSGVLKSPDGGASWTAANSGLPSQGGVMRLTVDRLNPNTLFAGAVYGPYAYGLGLFKSTNGGQNWRSAGLAGFPRADVLAIDPQNSNIVYAEVYSSPPAVSGSLYKSTNGGTTWTGANTGLPYYVIALAIDQHNPSTLYAATPYGIYRSANGGASWDPLGSGLTGLPVQAVAIDALNPATVYAGTSDGVFAMTVTDN